MGENGIKVPKSWFLAHRTFYSGAGPKIGKFEMVFCGENLVNAYQIVKIAFFWINLDKKSRIFAPGPEKVDKSLHAGSLSDFFPRSSIGPPIKPIAFLSEIRRF